MSIAKVIIIVAHPDDEILWAGSTLWKFRHLLDLTFVCCTNYRNEQRTKELAEVGVAYGARVEMLQTRGWFERYGDAELLREFARLGIEGWSCILTHSRLGELNQQPDHRWVRATVKKYLRQKHWDGLLVSFGIGTDPDIQVFVSDEERAAKKAALRLHSTQQFYLEKVLLYADSKVESFKIEPLEGTDDGVDL